MAYERVQMRVREDGELFLVCEDESDIIVNNEYAATQSTVHGVCQLVIAAVIIGINAAALALDPMGSSVLCQGFWSGGMYIVTGLLGFIAGNKKTRCPIIAFFVFCIITTSVVSPGAMAASLIGLIYYDNPCSSDQCEQWRTFLKVILMLMPSIQIKFALFACIMSGRVVCNCYVRKRVSMGRNSNTSSTDVVGSSSVYGYERGTMLYETYNSLQSMLSGAAQVTIGILLFAFNCALLYLKLNGMGMVCHGFWGGLMFIIAGCCGIAAARNKTKCPIIAYLTLSILAVVFAVAVFIVTVFGLILRWEDCTTVTTWYMYNLEKDCNYQEQASTALHSVMLVLAVLEVPIAIWGCIVTGRVICGCCWKNKQVPVRFKSISLDDDCSELNEACHYLMCFYNILRIFTG